MSDIIDVNFKDEPEIHEAKAPEGIVDTNKEEWYSKLDSFGDITQPVPELTDGGYISEADENQQRRDAGDEGGWYQIANLKEDQVKTTLTPGEPIPPGDDRWTEEKLLALEESIRKSDEARSPKGKICQFPCSCPNPNDCCHDSDPNSCCPDGCGGCDRPAVIKFDNMFLCQMHHDYHLACMYR